MTANRRFTKDDVAFDWVQSRFNVQAKELIADHPWSKVFRLQGEVETAYLKLVPTDNKKTLETSTLIHHYFADIAPEIRASDKALGLLILREHVGIPLNELSSEIQLRKLLQTYAGMQAKAMSYDEILNRLPSVNITTLLQDLLGFLNAESSPEEGYAGGGFFLDAEESKNYALALSLRQSLLVPLLEAAMQLPNTLNHGDLHTENVAEGSDGAMIIYDWDDACIAPAGLSLHLLFNGCSIIAELLTGETATADRDEAFYQRQRLLQVYIDTLVDAGYTDKKTLNDAIQGSVLAGTILSIINYSQFPDDDNDYKENIAKIIRNRLEDIVHLCDIQALKTRQNTLHYANDYLANGVPWRAYYLLEQYAIQHRNDADIHQRLADLCMQGHQWEEAIANYTAVVALMPDSVEAYYNLGLALLKNLQPELAIPQFENILRYTPNNEAALHYLEQANYILHSQNGAKIPHLAPTIRLTEQEMDNNLIETENLDLALSFFNDYGNVVVRNAFPVELIDAISELVYTKYSNYFEDKEYEDNLVLGDKRRMITLDIEGVLNTPRLYGSQVLVGMMKELLAKDYVLASCNATISLPGAKDQGLHKDYTPLFKNADESTHVTPPFAIAMLIPLLDMTPELGVTAMRKASQLVPEQMPFDMPVQAPVLNKGDGIIFDYRTAHEGLANRSDQVRPLLCLVFHRIWFRDALNYDQQKDVSISQQEFEKVPEDLKHLFKWVI